jgi:hypothetical protein
MDLPGGQEAVLNLNGEVVMAKHLAVSGIAPRMVLGMTILMMASTAALADPVTLSCMPAMAGTPFVLKLDISNKTVSGDGNYGYEPKDPRSILVSDDEITWVVEGDSNNTLSRVTGSFLSVGIGTSTGGRWFAQCHKSERQF